MKLQKRLIVNYKDSATTKKSSFGGPPPWIDPLLGKNFDLHDFNADGFLTPCEHHKSHFGGPPPWIDTLLGKNFDFPITTN